MIKRIDNVYNINTLESALIDVSVRLDKGICKEVDSVLAKTEAKWKATSGGHAEGKQPKQQMK